MPYYYKDKNTNKIWSNADIEGAEPIKEAYRYYSMLDTSSNKGWYCSIDSFYIKDGSLPWFNAGYNTTAEINVKYGYMPVIRLCNSSISGKYYIHNGSYVIPYGMTPMLYKTEIFKGVDSGFSAEHTMVDYSKGGKVSWRMSEQNLRYFKPDPYLPVNIGPTTSNCDTATSANNFKIEFKQINDVFRTNAFVYPWYNTPSNIFPIDPSIGVFINSKPDYNIGYNAFDFTETHNVTGNSEFAPPHFTLTVSSITSVGYNKLKVKMDALYLYMNGISLSPLTSYTDSVVNNPASFSADANITNKTYNYCQSLFYAINEDLKWSIPHISNTTEYIGNGEIYSNLSKPSANTDALASGKLVVSNTAEYSSAAPIPYNDCTVKEIQELSNINVWNHMILQQVVDNVDLTSTFKRFQFYNKKTGETFNGFIKDGVTAVSDKSTLEAVRENHIGDDVNNKRYEEKDWDDTNWNESLPTTTSTYGCFCVKDSTTADFPNYRQLFFNNDTSAGYMCSSNFTNTASTAYNKLSSLSSNWLLYSCQTNRNENYYYGHSPMSENIKSRFGINGDGSVQFDLIYKKSTVDKDKYKNVIPDLSTEQQYKTTGYSPSAGICYSYTNVKLEHTIDLTNETRKYLHIAYPFITVFNNNNNQGLLEQMIVTYSAEK